MDGTVVVAATLGPITPAITVRRGSGTVAVATLGPIVPAATIRRGSNAGVAASLGAITSASAVRIFRRSILLRQDIEPIWLVEITYLSDGEEVTEYLSTHAVSFIGDPDAPTVQYEPGILSPLQINRSMFGGDQIGGVAFPSIGGVEWSWGDTFRASGRLRTWREAAWDQRTVNIRLGYRGATFRDYTLLHEGSWADAPKFDLGKVTFQLADASGLLDREISAPKYTGAGGVNGSEDLKDRSRPEVLGLVFGAVPITADAEDLIYDVSHSGIMPAPAPVVRDGLVMVPISTNPTPPAGQVYIDYVNGRMVTGSKPIYGLTIDCRGAFAGGATDAATILSALCTDRLSIPASKLDASSFAQLSEDAPWTVGRHVTDTITGLQLANELMASVDGYFTGRRGGFLAVGQVPRPTATSQDDPSVVLVITDAMLDEGNVTVEPESAPPSRFEVGWGRRWAGAVADVEIDDQNATAEAINFAKSEYRVSAVDVPGQAAKHPSSKTKRIDTLLAYEADANALRDRLASGYGAERARYNVSIGAQPFALELGQQVWIESVVNDISAPVIALGLDENGRDFKAGMVGWG